MTTESVSRILWLCGFAALIAVGIPQLGRSRQSTPLVDHGPNSSVNAILYQSLDQREAGEEISSWLSQLSTDRPLLIVAHPDYLAASTTLYSVAYLAWPRPVVLSLDQARSRSLLPNYREQYAGVAFCYLPLPPGLMADKQLGPALAFVKSPPLAK